MADISKIKLPGSTVAYDIKDSTARANLAAEIAKLKGGAYVDTTATLSGGSNLPTDSAVKTYVDAEVAKINKFDVVVPAKVAAEIPAGAVYKDSESSVTGTLAASKDTMYKLYLVKNIDAGAGAYTEWITVRTGAEGSYTYAWECIGSTAVDLTDYVKKSTQIANVTINGGISVADLSAAGALNLGELSHKNSGTFDKVTGIEMNAVTVAGNATVTYTDANATIQYESYTPQGTISSNAIVDGSISVSVKDASSTTAATLDKSTISYATGALTSGTASFVNTASFVADATNGVQVTGSISKPDITVTQTTASVRVADSEGTAYQLSESSVTQAADTTANFVKKAYDFAMSTASGEGETLIISVVDTTDTNFFTTAVTKAGTVSYTAPTLSGALPTFKDQTVASNAATASLAAAPTFTGDKFNVSVTTATALNSVSATTASFDNVTGVNYLKQEIDTATFTKSTVAPTVEFTGTSANIKASTVTYSKADATAAFSQTVTPTTKTISTTPTSVTFA